MPSPPAIAAASAWAPADTDVGRSAAGACAGGARSLVARHPALLAGETAQLARFDTVLAAADEDRLAADEGLRHFGAAALQDAADGLTRHAHGLGGALVAEAFEIDKAYGLEFVNRELKLLELAPRHACRLEERDTGDSPHRTLNRWTRHGSLS